MVNFCKIKPTFTLYKKSTAFLFVLSLIIISILSTPRVFAAGYSASLTTSGNVSITGNSGGDGTSIDSDELTVITNCHAGYNLSISTSTADNNLYLGGDDNINEEDTYFAPVDETTSLSSTVNRWGYLLSSNAPSGSNTFSAVPNKASEPDFLKSAPETASESDINDSFSVYFGVSTSRTISSGTYKMIKDNNDVDGAIVYNLTVAPTCADSATVTFNENLDGAGAEGTDNTLANFPSTSDNIINVNDNTITLSDKRPTRTGYIFKEWNTETDGTGSYYKVGETVPMGQDGLSGFITLYAIWVEDCASATICYNDNHADAGTMSNQTATNGANTALIPSNFSRSGYGFAGWNTEADGTGTNYGPNQTITMPDSGGLTLFANWVKSSGTLQAWSDAANMNVGDIIALRDVRDNEVYAVAKLADNNIWIIENLRLVPETANITINNTNHPTSDFLTAYPNSTSSTMCSSDNAECDDSVKYNTNNLNRNLTQDHSTNDNSSAWYSYGVMYNWYTATAGNGTYSKTSGNVAGDLCPAGWHLPTGGSNGEWGGLNSAVNNNQTNKDTGLRTYPVNLIWSGDYNSSENSSTGRGTQGRIWTATANSNQKAYRMGYSVSTATATANAYNKWDGFNVRCIYQGGNTPFVDVTVNFAGTGVTSVTFENNDYGIETATLANPTISLAEDVTYTITANLTPGYELTNWSTTTGGTLGSDSANPTTYTATEDTTLTATGTEIPIYEVTVNLGEHVTSVSFTNPDYGTQQIINENGNGDGTDSDTVNLRQGVIYTITSNFETGYTIDEWTTTPNGVINNATATTTTYAITGISTLSVSAQEATELGYTLVYHAGLGTDAPDSESKTSYSTTEDFTITNSAPIYYGYTFTGWSETADNDNNGTTIDYTSGDTITISSTGTTTTKTLYAVYSANSCPSGKICYYDNGADVIDGGRGTMSNQSASSNSTATLIPSNYSKSGYGFAGWAIDANTTPYGPNATISTPDLSSNGLALYAKWIKSTGEMQSWSGCSSLTLNSVIALTDTRDNNTYAIAKLADDNCWLIENLRLDPGIADITIQNTHNPTNTFITQSNVGAGLSLSTNTMCKADNDTTCLDSIQYNSNSTKRSLTQSYNGNSNSSAWYSYGTYYNWYTATAGQGTYSTNNNTNVAGDICPSKWRLPTGNSTGEYNALNTAVNSGSTSSDAGLRAYPVNFLWSGDYNNTNRNSSYSNGRIWTATTKDSPTAYRIGYASNTVTASTNAYNKWDGFIVRCLYDGEVANYNNVTVTIPTGVSSVTFTSSKYGTATATTSNNVVSLAENANYTITAQLTTGYEFDEWINGANSTIGDNYTNPTTFSITNDTTLTLSAHEIPTYTVTVNIDSNVTGVTFTNANYGTYSVTTTGSTVTLRHGVVYTISSNYASGYKISSWSTTENGQLGSTTTPSTTFVVTGTATLSLTSEIMAPPTSCDTPITGITYMQDITSSNRDAVLASLTTNKAYYLRDSRDGEPYCVSKLEDGNLWMLDNLRLDLTSSNVKNNLSSTTTNASDTTLNYLKNGGGTTSNQYATSGVKEWSSSRFSSSRSYSDPLVATSGNCVDDPTYVSSCVNDPEKFKWSKDSVMTKTNETGDGSNKVGAYYNYCAATAGSYCYGNGTNNYGTPTNDATEDICPVNWRLPTGGDNGELQTLATAISGYTGNIPAGTTGSSNFRKYFSIARSGHIFNGVAYDQYNTDDGGVNHATFTITSSTRASNYEVFGLHIYPLSIMNSRPEIMPKMYLDRDTGYPVRCMLQQSP